MHHDWTVYFGPFVSRHQWSRPTQQNSEDFGYSGQCRLARRIQTSPGQRYALSKPGYYFPQEKGVSLADIIPTASPEAIDLIESMLKYSSRKRPTAAEFILFYSEFWSTITLRVWPCILLRTLARRPFLNRSPRGLSWILRNRTKTLRFSEQQNKSLSRLAGTTRWIPMCLSNWISWSTIVRAWE